VVRRTPEVSLAIETGMIWTHKDGFVCTIEPNSIETVFPIPGIVQRPKKQNSVYNFIVVPFSEDFI
jgi:hypothetical protein